MDVQCPTCQAEPFMPCTYADITKNRKLNRVGLPMFRRGYPYYHNERQYLQNEFDHCYSAYMMRINTIELQNWLTRYGDIFSECA